MTKLKKMIIFVCMLVVTVTMLLGDTVYATGSKKKIKSIAWKDYYKNLTIEVGEKVKLAVVYTPKKNIDKSLKWKSSKKKSDLCAKN